MMKLRTQFSQFPRFTAGFAGVLALKESAYAGLGSPFVIVVVTMALS